MIIKSNLFMLVSMFLPLTIFVGVSLVEDVKANWISYIESRQAGNCESGSRAWSSAIAYYISKKYAHNLADAQAWFDCAMRLQSATESNPVASVNIELCDSIMDEVSNYDVYDDREHNCQHECEDDCDDECFHECDDECYSYDSRMTQAIETLQNYSHEWSNAYEYASKGSFIRAMRIPENLHVIADRLSITTYANPNAIIAGYRDREAFTSSEHVRMLPRVDFSQLLQDSDSFDTLIFMSQFANDQFDSFAQLSVMTMTPCASVSLLAFRREPTQFLRFFENVSANVAQYAIDNPIAYRKAYAFYLVQYAREKVKEHAVNTLYNYDVNLHRQVSTSQLTEVFNTVRYNDYNVFQALVRLTQYAFQGDVAHYVSSVNYFVHLARTLENSLSHIDTSRMTVENVDDNLSYIYYWREIHNRAWASYVQAMRARYDEINAPRIEAS